MRITRALTGYSAAHDQPVLRREVGWGLLAIMILCCLCLSLADLPDEWRIAQNVAAIMQAFVSGIVVAQWLPIWTEAHPGYERPSSSADTDRPRARDHGSA